MMSLVIFFDEYPMPPQSNHMYENRLIFMKGGRRAMGRRKSEKYIKFEQAVQDWAATRADLIRKARVELRVLLSTDPRAVIIIDTVICCSHDTLYAKAKRRGEHGSQRIWDVSNRIKCQHDTLAKLLDIDDHRWQIGLMTKALDADATTNEPYLLMRLTVGHMPTRDAMLERLR